MAPVKLAIILVAIYTFIITGHGSNSRFLEARSVQISCPRRLPAEGGGRAERGLPLGKTKRTHFQAPGLFRPACL